MTEAKPYTRWYAIWQNADGSLRFRVHGNGRDALVTFSAFELKSFLDAIPDKELK